LSIYGCDTLEVPVALTEVEGAEPDGSLEVPVVLTEVEGAKPGGAPVAVVMSGGVCRGLSLGVRQCRRATAVVFGVVVENVIVEFMGESPCEQFFVSMNTSVLSL